jgi:hypothetical protein
MPAPSLQGPGPALPLALLLVTAAFAGCAQSDPPEDPSQAEYIYDADADEKAPHPASYDGGYGTLRLEGPSVEVEAAGPVDVRPRNPDGPVTVPADVDVHDASGTFHPDDGGNRTFQDTTVHLRADDGFTIPGVEAVGSSRVTFEDGTVEARSTAAVAGNDTTFAPSRTVSVGDDGAVVEGASVVVGNATGLDGSNGTLELDPGTYGVTGTPLEVEAAGPVDVPASGGTVGLEEATADVTLRAEDRTVDDVELGASRVEGTVDPGASETTLDLGLHQWTDDRPRFEARLEAAFEDGSTTQEVTVEPGGNATFWTKASETRGVGSAEEVRPRLDEGDDVDAAFSVYWYDDPDPHIMEQFVRAVIFPAKALESIFQDPATTRFHPGTSSWIPLGVEVADGTEPGEYSIDGWFHGANARSNDLTVEVTVTEG